MAGSGAVQVKLELGHRAQVRKKPTVEGFTHDWMVFVRGPEHSNIQHFVEKVVFHLHESFPKPKRGSDVGVFLLKHGTFEQENANITSCPTRRAARRSCQTHIKINDDSVSKAATVLHYCRTVNGPALRRCHGDSQMAAPFEQMEVKKPFGSAEELLFWQSAVRAHAA
ncbi:hypothetical protein LDENG_00253760 [Lucifuga dentata]|nr:hypothetical protein LDENG_00253760 [Lucifuga dentata]